MSTYKNAYIIKSIRRTPADTKQSFSFNNLCTVQLLQRAGPVWALILFLVPSGAQAACQTLINRLLVVVPEIQVLVATARLPRAVNGVGVLALRLLDTGIGELHLSRKLALARLPALNVLLHTLLKRLEEKGVLRLNNLGHKQIRERRVALRNCTVPRAAAAAAATICCVERKERKRAKIREYRTVRRGAEPSTAKR